MAVWIFFSLQPGLPKAAKDRKFPRHICSLICDNKAVIECDLCEKKGKM